MNRCKVDPGLLKRFTTLLRSRRSFSVPAASETEFSVKPESNFSPPPVPRNESKESIDHLLPPIIDLSLPAKRRRHREVWYDKVRKLSTVEEKIFELNMPRYYGWRVYTIKEGSIPYNPLPLAQYVTRTHVVNTPGLPAYYDNLMSPETLDSSVQQIKSQVEDAIGFEYSCRQRDYQFDKIQLEDRILMDNVMAKVVSQHINRIFTINLSPSYNHLLESQVDYDPRIEAFWFFGGFEVPKEVHKARSGKEWTKVFADEPVNQAIKYDGSPIFQLRHSKPLEEIIPLKDSEDSSLEIPVENHDPRKLGYFQDRKRATIIPGFWPGDQNEFGFMSYHNRGHLTRRPEQFADNLDAITTQAIFGSFSWLYTQACYQGFSTFQDVTYPLVNQMIITNGQWWSFVVYQLNTITMHADNINENPRKNICWITEPMKLFDSVEGDKVQGLNEDVLKHLMKFYKNAPKARENVEMKPYIGQEKLIADIEDPERRVWLEDKYKYLMSNRSRHRLMPEIYHWQKIYLIKYKTRPLDKKREPWEYGVNFLKRRLDDHTPEYVPKCKRSHPKSKEEKWAKTYYPTVPGEEKIERKSVLKYR